MEIFKRKKERKKERKKNVQKGKKGARNERKK